MSIVLPNPPDLPGDGEPSVSYELDVQRRLTSYFISTQPVYLDLVPRSKVKQPTGGFVWESSPARQTQRMRLVEPSTPSIPYTGSDGQVRETEFELLGEWDSVLGRYDRFSLDGKGWEIAELYHYNGWERRAAVIAYG